jgi:hypothetical protein
MPVKVTKYYKAYQYEFQNFIMLAVSVLLDSVSKEAVMSARKERFFFGITTKCFIV